MKEDRNPDINPHTYGQLIYDKGSKTIQWKKQSLPQQMVLGKLNSYMKTTKLQTFSNSINSIKINSKWIKDLSVRLGTIKILEENTGRTLFDINCSNIFLDLSPTVMEIKTKINKWGRMTLLLLHSKGNHNKNERQPTNWEKISANDATNKELISKTHSSL